MSVPSWCVQWGLQSPGITARWKGGAEGNDLFWKAWREVIVNKATCTGKGFRRVQPGWHAGHVCMAQRSCWGEKSQAGGRTSQAIAANPRLKNVRGKGERERRHRMLGVWGGGFGFTPTACGICARERSPRAAPFGRASSPKGLAAPQLPPHHGDVSIFAVSWTVTLHCLQNLYWKSYLASVPAEDAQLAQLSEKERLGRRSLLAVSQRVGGRGVTLSVFHSARREIGPYKVPETTAVQNR